MTSNLYQQIQQFYDASSPLWEKVWGEHMHHGYYGPDGNWRKERRQAQIDLIEEVLAWGNITEKSHKPQNIPQNILDVGCGIGGSALYLADKFKAQVTGITLSPVQAKRASERAKEADLEDSTRFLVANALDLPFEDGEFDFVWSMESGEHMPDKQKFLAECYRVLKPGGIFLMATWCHRPIDRNSLTDDEKKHLADIYQLYHLPSVISLREYQKIAESLRFQSVRVADWSTAVAPFWDIVLESLLDGRVFWGILQSGWLTFQGALAIPLMSRGYERGLIRYGLLCGVK